MLFGMSPRQAIELVRMRFTKVIFVAELFATAKADTRVNASGILDYLFRAFIKAFLEDPKAPIDTEGTAVGDSYHISVDACLGRRLSSKSRCVVSMFVSSRVDLHHIPALRSITFSTSHSSSLRLPFAAEHLHLTIRISRN